MQPYETLHLSEPPHTHTYSTLSIFLTLTSSPYEQRMLLVDGSSIARSSQLAAPSQ